MTLDMSAASAYTCSVHMNASNNSTSQGLSLADNTSFTLKGASKTPFTFTNGALTAGDLSCVVDDATGWLVGDKLIFATTQSFANTAYSVTSSTWSGGYLTCNVASTTGLVKGSRVSIASMQSNLNYIWTVYDIPGSTSFRIAMSDPTVTDGVGTATLEPKTDEVTIATITPGSGTTATITWTDGVGTGGGLAYNHADDCLVGNWTRNVRIGGNTVLSKSFLHFVAKTATRTFVMESTEFYNMYGGYTSYPNGSLNITNNTSGLSAIDKCSFYHSGIYFYATSTETEIKNCVAYGAISFILASQVFRSQLVNNNLIVRGYTGIGHCTPNDDYNNNYISGCTYAMASGAGLGGYSRDNHIWSCGSSMYMWYGNWLEYNISGTDIGTRHSASCAYVVDGGNYMVKATLTDCDFQAANLLYRTTNYAWNKFTIVNKNNDAGVQEIYGNHSTSTPIIQRDTDTITRSTSSIEMTCNASTAIEHEFSVLAKSGETVTLKTYVRKNSSYGSSTLPSVTISGLGITPVVSTMDSGTAADAWELLTTSATNSGSSDGLLTVTFTAQSSTAGAKAYFSGTPCAPFVTRARHYGYLFQETIPTVTVDPYVVAAEATAAAYTGVTIDGTGKDITFAAGTADTAQKFYDYTRAWCALNVEKEVPFERSGSVYALDADWTVIDPYYSGDLTWSGGTVQYSTYGTLADNLDGCIVEFTDTGGGTYTLTGTISGTLDLRNLDADPITVEVPVGTTTTTANNTGGTITVQEPQVYQSVTLTGGEAGSRVQLYDVTSSTELYNDVPGSWPFTWTDPDPYSADREIRLRVMWVDGADAKQFIDQTIGTVTDVSPALPYLVSQLDDAVYIANGIDGSALTGYAIVGTNLRIDVSDGTATWAEMYAYQVYWLSTEDGIRDQDLFIFGIDTANYLFYGGFKIKNTSAPSVPLLVTGGNGEPSSGPATDLLDTTGGTIFCNSAIVVPYSSGAEVTEQIVRDGLTSQGYTTTRAGKIDTVPDDVWAEVLEGTLTAAQIQRIKLAALAGKRQGLGTATEAYLAQDGVTPRVIFTPADAAGNGTTVVDGA